MGQGEGDISWGSKRPGPLSGHPWLSPTPSSPHQRATLTDPHLPSKFLSSQMGQEGCHPNLFQLAAKLPSL